MSEREPDPMLTDVDMVKVLLRRYLKAFRRDGASRLGAILRRVAGVDSLPKAPRATWPTIVEAARTEARAAGYDIDDPLA